MPQEEVEPLVRNRWEDALATFRGKKLGADADGEYHNSTMEEETDRSELREGGGGEGRSARDMIAPNHFATVCPPSWEVGRWQGQFKNECCGFVQKAMHLIKRGKKEGPEGPHIPPGGLAAASPWDDKRDN